MIITKKIAMLEFQNYQIYQNFFQNFCFQDHFHVGLIFIEPYVSFHIAKLSLGLLVFDQKVWSQIICLLQLLNGQVFDFKPYWDQLFPLFLEVCATKEWLFNEAISPSK
jgi:hypothetical protein